MSKIKHSFPIIILVVAIIGIIAGILLSQQPQSQLLPQPTPTPALRGVLFRGVDIATATTGGIISIMGNATKTQVWQNQKALIYTSGTTNNEPIKVIAGSNNNIQSIIEPAQKGTKLSVLQASLGKEDVILYGNYYYYGYFLYTYLSLGTAILANPKTDDVKQRLYFSPTTLPTFIQTVGVGFQTDPLPSGQE